MNLWKRLGPVPKLLIAMMAAFAVYLPLDYYGIVGTRVVESLLPQQVDLPTVSTSDYAAPDGFVPSPPPGNTPARMTGAQMRIAGWAWSSQMGMWYAMGGNVPMQGSLMEKYGANIYWYRQDDVPQMQADLITCAQEMSSSGQDFCYGGATHVSIMWDGAPAFVTGVNRTLERLGNEYTVEYVGSMGYSRGEDKCMGLPGWKQNPQSMRGGLIAGVIGDGDWNICLKFMGDNGVPNNPDDTTYDPDAVNWVRTTGYIEASEKYISQYCEVRDVVNKGRRTGEKKRVCVDGVATWTPGDVMVAEQRGGLVSLASTKEYSSQMPNAIIGIKKFGMGHPDTIENFLRAALEGGDNIKYNPGALSVAAAISADVYGEETPAYWEKYYTVQREKDVQGLMSEFGGSYANNLADNLRLFGLLPGTSSIAEAVYVRFGDLLVQQHPVDFPSYTPVEEIINTRYITAVRNKVGEPVTEADTPSFSRSGSLETISKRSWQINFVTGSAEFTPQALATLEELHRDLTIADSLQLSIIGHTDSDGDEGLNQQLSERRAEAVQRWLVNKSPNLYPNNRFVRVEGFGESRPIADNNTREGKAQNRRVEIALSTRR